MTKVIVIGGGASGLMAAICAAKHGAEVTILERNNQLGKKLLATGNGKCNYWNEDQNIEHYHSANPELLSQIITITNQEKVLHLFDKLGIVPKIKNGYYYPYANQAISLKASLENELKCLGVQLCNNELVKTIEKKNGRFYVITDIHTYTSDRIILSTGSKAAPKTGSDGNGYILAKKLGHHIISVLPSLTQVYGQDNYYKDWNGIRILAKLTLYENENLIKEEVGELQLTDYGISGVCTFNLSGIIAKGLNNHKKEIIYINFLPDLFFKNKKSFVNWMNERDHLLKNRTIAQLFDGFIPYKLVYLFLNISHINPNDFWQNIEENKKLEFASLFLKHEFKVKKTNDYDSS